MKVGDKVNKQMGDCMTKQEIIKAGIRHLMDGCYNAHNPDYPKLSAFQPGKFLNELLPYLDDNDVVIPIKETHGNTS